VTLKNLATYEPDSDLVQIIVEAPRGSRNKFKFDNELGLFKLDKILPLGAFFPFDYGFIPSTQGADGDPLDVLVVMDDPTFVGCLITGKIIGVIEAKQTEKGKTIRNDRLICACVTKRNPAKIHSIDEMNTKELDEIGHFFSSYNEMEGRKFKVIGHKGPRIAQALLKKGIQAFQEGEEKKSRNRMKKSWRSAENSSWQSR
jgi:inorganic pyrophosphatase